MPKGKTEMTSAQRAAKEAAKLAATFTKRLSKKLDAFPSVPAAKDLRTNLRSFSGAATKQLNEISKAAATASKKPTKPAPTSKPKKSGYAKRKS